MKIASSQPGSLAPFPEEDHSGRDAPLAFAPPDTFPTTLPATIAAKLAFQGSKRFAKLAPTGTVTGEPRSSSTQDITPSGPAGLARAAARSAWNGNPPPQSSAALFTQRPAADTRQIAVAAAAAARVNTGPAPSRTETYGMRPVASPLPLQPASGMATAHLAPVPAALALPPGPTGLMTVPPQPPATAASRRSFGSKLAEFFKPSSATAYLAVYNPMSSAGRGATLAAVHGRDTNASAIHDPAFQLRQKIVASPAAPQASLPNASGDPNAPPASAAEIVTAVIRDGGFDSRQHGKGFREAASTMWNGLDGNQQFAKMAGPIATEMREKEQHRNPPSARPHGLARLRQAVLPGRREAGPDFKATKPQPTLHTARPMQAVPPEAAATRDAASFEARLATLFPGNDAAGESDRATLAILLQSVPGSLLQPVQRSEQPDLPLALPTLLAEALASASGGDAGRALAGARTLASGDLVRADAAPDGGDASFRDGWAAAQLLARSGGGMKALAALVRQGGDQVTDYRLQHLRIMLKATEALQAKWGLPHATPAEIRAAGAGNPMRNKLGAYRGLEAAKKLWPGSSTTPNAGAITPGMLGRSEKRGYWALQQNLSTEGPGAVLPLVEARLEKGMGTWMDRLESTVSERRADRFMQVVGMRKNPWRAAVTIGSQGGQLASLQRMQECYDTALLDGAGVLANQIGKRITRDCGVMSTEALTRAALDQATLAAWATDRARAQRPEQTRLAEGRGRAIVADAGVRLVALREQFPVYRVGLDRSIAALPGQAPDLAPLTLERLESLRRNLPRPMRDARDLHTPLSLARRIADRQAVKADLPTIDAAQQFTGKILDELVSGGVVRMSNGGIVGVNNARVGIPIVPGVQAGADPRLTRSRNAVVEWGVGAHGLDWFMGSTTKTSAHLGGFVSAGLHEHIAGATGIVRAGREDTETTGVRMRFSRRTDARGKVVQRGPKGATRDNYRDTGNRVKDVLFDYARARRDGTAGDATALDRLIDLCMEDKTLGDEVSVSYQGHAGVTQRMEAGLTGSLGGAFGGVGASLFHEHTLFAGQNRSERNGRVQRTILQTAQGRRNVGAVYAGLVNPTVLGQPEAERETLQALRLLGANVTFAESGSGVSFRATQEDGSYVPTLTYRDRDFQSYDEYKATIEANRVVWDGIMGHANVDIHLAETLATIGRNQPFAMRFMGTSRLGELMDSASAALSMLPDNPNGARRGKALVDDLAGRLGQDQYWQPLRLYVQENTARERSWRAALGLHLETTTRVEATRELRRDGPNTVVSTTAPREERKRSVLTR